MKKIHFWLLLIFVSIGCTISAQIKDEIPLHETFPLLSKHVGEKRIINVWTPPEYAQSKDSLAVLYMADGGIQEDFPHIANTIAELVKAKKIQPIILVGIENTVRRRDLTPFTEIEEDKKVAPVVGGSENFRKFIKDELIPHINKHYRTSKRKGIIGESLSGLFVMETFFSTPYLFDDYVAMDPSLWWNNHYLVRTAKEHLAKFPSTEKRIWFAGSNAQDVSPFTKELAEILKAENKENIKWKFSDEPKEKHTTIFRATKEKAIVWTLNKTE